MKGTRRQLRKRKTRKQKGGSNATATTSSANTTTNNTPKQPKIDCAAEGFDLEMRHAAFGRGYTIGVGGVHEDGEQWSYDETAERLLGGMVDWYRRTLEKRNIITPYTQQELIDLNNNKVLKDLAVFFNRYKIVAEKAPIAVSLFNAGARSIYTNIFPEGTYVGPESFATMLSKIKQNGSKYKLNGYGTVKINATVVKALEILASFKDIDFSAKDLALEKAIDRAQCIIFYIVKHKGQLPPGFQMDERISRRAHEELRMSIPYDILKSRDLYLQTARLLSVQKWLSFLIEADAELTNPEVTFNVF